MKVISIVLLLILSLTLSACSPFSDKSISTLGNEVGAISSDSNQQLQKLFEESDIPSLAVGILVDNEMIWAKGYGNQPDLSTVYMIGSIDKTFITIAILQLHEQERINLDDDVNQFLPFSVRHPDYPDIPITIQMLLTHMAGLSHDFPGTRYTDNDGPMLRWMFSNEGNQFWDLYHSYFPPSEDKYLENLFLPESKYGSDFWISKPGTQYQYSNSAYYLLLKRVIEAASSQNYDVYIQENIIEPLGMENTSFDAYDYPEEQLAVPYENFGENGSKDFPLTGISASGRLRSNVIDLSKYLLVHMNQGRGNDHQILQAESVNMMHDQTVVLNFTDFPPMELEGLGLSWFLWEDGYQGHPGATPGYLAQIIYNEGDKMPYGIVILMTYGCSKTECDFDWFNKYYVGIREILFSEAEMIALDK